MALAVIHMGVKNTLLGILEITRPMRTSREVNHPTLLQAGVQNCYFSLEIGKRSHANTLAF